MSVFTTQRQDPNKKLDEMIALNNSRREKRNSILESIKADAKAADEKKKLDEVDKMEEEKKDRLVKNCISIGGIVLPVAVTIWGTLKSLKFEESGTVTTIMGRGFINKLLPKK